MRISRARERYRAEQPSVGEGGESTGRVDSKTLKSMKTDEATERGACQALRQALKTVKHEGEAGNGEMHLQPAALKRQQQGKHLQNRDAVKNNEGHKRPVVLTSLRG